MENMINGIYHDKIKENITLIIWKDLKYKIFTHVNIFLEVSLATLVINFLRNIHRPE